jgi:methylmalonyl-CoA mutase
MASNADQQTIFTSFKPNTKNDWIKTASKELNGADAEQKLSFFENSITVKPYYDQSDRVSSSAFALHAFTIPYLGARAWLNVPKLKVIDEESSNKSALEALSNGADGILFEVPGDSTKISSQKLLNKIDFKYCGVSFLLNDISFDWLEELRKKINIKTEPTNLAGTLFFPSPEKINADFVKKWNHYHTVGITIQQSDPVTEIVDALTEILRTADRLTDQGLAAREIFAKVTVMMTMDPRFFFSIAKLKALQFLWAQILDAYNVQEKIILPIHVIAQAGKNSMISNTTVGLSAILGGCHALTIEPEDENNPRMVRVARNVSTVLREESHLSKVSDPTRGSYYIDHLTQSFAQAAWEKIIAKQ